MGAPGSGHAARTDHRRGTQRRIAGGLPHRGKLSAAAVLVLAYPLRRPGSASELTSVTLPALVVQGTADPFGTPAEMPPLPQNMTLVEIPGPAETGPVPWYLTDPYGGAGGPGDSTDLSGTGTLEDALWAALCAACDDGADIGELMRVTGMGRSTVYRYLSQFARDGRARQVGWGRWRADTTSGGGDE